jgi:EAL domain-containing protein (putative c-di-GMP-specific phosphodiesterase class I)
VTWIDHWMIRRAVGMLAESQADRRRLRLEVNVSAAAMYDPSFLDRLDEELNATQIEPSGLILEMDETVAVEHLDHASRLASSVRGMGCRFALQNFGQSFGALRHLRQLPVDFLKLDGSLVSTIRDSRTDQVVVRSLVDVARGVGADSIATFVNDDETLVLLRQQGVGYAQGYRIGRPRVLNGDWPSALPS